MAVRDARPISVPLNYLHIAGLHFLKILILGYFVYLDGVVEIVTILFHKSQILKCVGICMTPICGQYVEEQVLHL